MPRESQDSLSADQAEELLSTLEGQGRAKWLQRWKGHMAFPGYLTPTSTQRDEQEKVLRYLLFRVLVNQQASFDKVRETCMRISEEFRESLLFDPAGIVEDELFALVRDIAGERASALYRVGSIGGVKPISLFAYRFKAYEAFIRWLKKHGQLLLDLVAHELEEGQPRKLFDLLNKHPVLEVGWVGNDPKACRMYVDWVVFLFDEVWKHNVSGMSQILMIVDGHVGKVFCRTGLLGSVLYEKRRPYIIQASKMRRQIEEVVATSGRIPFYVDNGAFYLFEDGFCSDLDPDCTSCPIGEVCKRYTKWTAYQKQPAPE